MPSGDAREGSDTPGRREPKEWEKGRAKVLGTFSARAHRKRRETVWCVRLRGSRPQGWEATAFCFRDTPQRPKHKKDMT